MLSANKARCKQQLLLAGPLCKIMMHWTHTSVTHDMQQCIKFRSIQRCTYHTHAHTHWRENYETEGCQACTITMSLLLTASLLGIMYVWPLKILNKHSNIKWLIFLLIFLKRCTTLSFNKCTDVWWCCFACVCVCVWCMCLLFKLSNLHVHTQSTNTLKVNHIIFQTQSKEWTPVS